MQTEGFLYEGGARFESSQQSSPTTMASPCAVYLADALIVQGLANTLRASRDASAGADRPQLGRSAELKILASPSSSTWGV